MFAAIKNHKSIAAVACYLRTRTALRKLFDAAIVAMLLIVYGIAQGNIQIKQLNISTVESMLRQSKAVMTQLEEAHYDQPLVNFVAHLRLHNGTRTLNGQYSFGKATMTEYHTLPYIRVNPQDWTDIPISVDFSMMAALSNNECYTITSHSHHPLHLNFLKTNTYKLTACPIHDNKQNLQSIAVVSYQEGQTPDITKVRELADSIRAAK